MVFLSVTFCVCLVGPSLVRTKASSSSSRFNIIIIKVIFSSLFLRFFTIIVLLWRKASVSFSIFISFVCFLRPPSLEFISFCCLTGLRSSSSVEERGRWWGWDECSWLFETSLWYYYGFFIHIHTNNFPRLSCSSLCRLLSLQQLFFRLFAVLLPVCHIKLHNISMLESEQRRESTAELSTENDEEQIKFQSSSSRTWYKADALRQNTSSHSTPFNPRSRFS